MELRDLYTLSELIKGNVDKGDLPKDILDRMEIDVLLDPVTFYGVDKEFYYVTHGNTYNGFNHSELINATVNGIKFRITGETEKKKDEKLEII